MSNFVTVILSDNDKNLGNEFRMIGKFDNVFVPDGESETMTVLKLAVDGEVKEMLKNHNENRVKQVNRQTLERHGVEVNLQPIGIEDVKIEIKG